MRTNLGNDLFVACSSSKSVLVNTSKVSRLRPFHPFYPNNVQCTWRITAPQHQLITYSITKFDLAQPGDYLEIREISSTAIVVRNFTTKPDYFNEKWVSSGNNFLINFKSDNDTIGEGFELVWTFISKSKGSNAIYFYSQFL